MDKIITNKADKASSFKYIIMLIAAAAIWGSSYSVAKFVLSEITPFYLISVRYLLSFAVMGVLAGKKLLKATKGELKNGAMLGVLLFISATSLIYGLKYTTPGKQAFICGSYVVMLPFLLWGVDKIRPKKKVFVGAVICFIGIGLLSVSDGLKLVYGDMLTLVGALFLASHMIAVSKIGKEQDLKTVTAIQFGTIGILSTVLALVTGNVIKPVSFNVMISLAYLVLFATCLAMFMQIYCQKMLKPETVSVILSTETVFGSFFAWLMLGEIFTLKMVIGCVAIFVAMVMSEK